VRKTYERVCDVSVGGGAAFVYRTASKL